MGTNTEGALLANGLTPVFPVHPGSILGEELKARGIRQKDFAKQIGMQATHLSALIHGTRNFTAEIAAKIESGLKSIPADFWLRAQSKYQHDKNRRQRRFSDYVDGYGFSPHTAQATLHDADGEESHQRKFTVSVPETDVELLRIIADRMGWSL